MFSSLSATSVTFSLSCSQHSLENFKNHIHPWLPLTMLSSASRRAMSTLTFAHSPLITITPVPDFKSTLHIALETAESGEACLAILIAHKKS